MNLIDLAYHKAFPAQWYSKQAHKLSQDLSYVKLLSITSYIKLLFNSSLDHICIYVTYHNLTLLLIQLHILKPVNISSTCMYPYQPFYTLFVFDGTG